MNVPILCECNSFDCTFSIDLLLEKVQTIKANSDNIVIVDGCPRGPEPTDVLVSKESGYSIYREET